jgi:hypothetical protein
MATNKNKKVIEKLNHNEKDMLKITF